MSEVLLLANGDGTYDLIIDGRAGEYGLVPAEFDPALSRRRVPRNVSVIIDDEHGRRLHRRLR